MSSPHRPMLGIIGGTGMAEALGSLGSGNHHRVDTPFGPPSSPITVVEIAGAPVALLPRHGEGHRFPPGKVPYRANVFALKAVGVTHVLATAAAGSLREEIRPGELVVPDQIDRSHLPPRARFFEDLVVHVELARAVLCLAAQGPARSALGGERARRRNLRLHGGPAGSPPVPRATCTAPGARS